jgi:Zn-dependent protease
MREERSAGQMNGNGEKQRLAGIKKGLVSTGIIAIILKFLKPALIFLKPLAALLKLSKFGGTLVSMVVTVAVYAMIWGWWFALGFVILIFIHENGHMYAAKMIGLPVSRPVFIPFVGAFIAMKEIPKNAKEEALIGYGGPLAGTAGALACAAIYSLTGNPFWLALSYLGFFLNLFNLMPLGFLDGGRVASAVSCWLWIPGAVILTYMAVKYTNPVIFFVLILGVIQAYKVFKHRNEPEMINYYQIEPEFRFKMGLAYLFLLSVTGVGMGYSHSLLGNVQI